MPDEISTSIQKARLVFANLLRLRGAQNVRLSTKKSVYCTAVRSVILYDCAAWSLKVEHMRMLNFFGHRCLPSIAQV